MFIFALSGSGGIFKGDFWLEHRQNLKWNCPCFAFRSIMFSSRILPPLHCSRSNQVHEPVSQYLLQNEDILVISVLVSRRTVSLRKSLTRSPTVALRMAEKHESHPSTTRRSKYRKTIDLRSASGWTKWNLDLFNVKFEKDKYTNLRSFLGDDAYGMDSRLEAGSA